MAKFVYYLNFKPRNEDMYYLYVTKRMIKWYIDFNKGNDIGVYIYTRDKTSNHFRVTRLFVCLGLAHMETLTL